MSTAEHKVEHTGEQATRSHRELSDERRLGTQLHTFSNIISATFYQRTEVPFGIALSEWRVLQSAIAAPGTSQSDIAFANGLNVMTVSRAVSGLRTKGLVETASDPDDRRRSLLYATELGAELGADIAKRATQMYAHVFADLSSEELAVVGDVVRRVNSRLRTSELPEAPPAARDWAALIGEHMEQAETP